MTGKLDSIEVRKPWHIARAFFEGDGKDEEIQSNVEERQTTISKKEAALLEETNSNDPAKLEVRMMKEYRLYEVEEAIAEMDTLDVEDDIAETDEDMQLVISGWYVIIPELNLYLREGVVCIWDEEEKLFMPDFAVTVVYEGDIESKEWLYYEQDGFVVTLANWLNGRLPVKQIEQLRCEIVIPQQNVDANNNLIEGREE